MIESPLKIMKNVFYFVLKASLVLKIFKFLSRHFGHVGKIREIRFWTMKFGQLVEYNKINIFFKNYAENEAM